ncbi:perlucin-like protein [Anoplopoma fimbria]|uniref:perlucin-like protein n=1 Tax=Anoplopoma fimbria TaxID=229290 RepID=UPI0023EC1A6A|nr:perlucin-like protein [Anoplopoma fimbria]
MQAIASTSSSILSVAPYSLSLSLSSLRPLPVPLPALSPAPPLSHHTLPHSPNQPHAVHHIRDRCTLEVSCGRCQQGWSLLKSSCYYFSNRVSDSKKNWFDSRAHCKSQGGDLLVINNFAEQQLITDNIGRSSIRGVWWQNGFWIGLTDVVTPGTWIWVNNVTEVETMYWKIAMPSSDGFQSGNCAAFYQFPGAKESWYKGNCLDHLYNWICEMEPSSTGSL